MQRKFGYKTNHHTVKHFLALCPPVQLELNLLAFAQFADAYQARWTVVRMWYEGWNKQSIAGCLQMARSHVYAIIAAFERDGFEGLEDQRTRPSPHPDDQLTLPFLKDVLDLQQEYPRRGAFGFMGSWNPRMGRTSRVKLASGGPWQSIAACMGPPARGPAPAMSPSPRPSPATYPIGPTIGITSGLWIFGIS